VCMPGFTGDGLRCSQQNPCAKDNGGCDTNARCAVKVCKSASDSIGEGNATSSNAHSTGRTTKTVCMCNMGYTGNGIKANGGCEATTNPSSACGPMAPNGCPKSSFCVSPPAGPLKAFCACKAGYVPLGNHSIVQNVSAASLNLARGPVVNETASCREDAKPSFDLGMPGSLFLAGPRGCVAMKSCSNTSAPGHSGCDANAACWQRGPGVHMCSCNTGFEGDGVKCNPVDACASNTHLCHEDAMCIPDASSASNSSRRAHRSVDGRSAKEDVADKAPAFGTWTPSGNPSDEFCSTTAKVVVKGLAVGQKYHIKAHGALYSSAAATNGGAHCPYLTGISYDVKNQMYNSCPLTSGHCPGASCSCPGSECRVKKNQPFVLNIDIDAIATAEEVKLWTVSCPQYYTHNGTVAVAAYPVVNASSSRSTNAGSNAGEIGSSLNAVSSPDYTCKCRPGFTGDGMDCVPTSICLSDNGGCDAHATCTPLPNMPTRRTCACNEGYAGSGVKCASVNPCATNNGGCHASKAECRHTGPGKHSCMCRAGYKLAGADCVLEEDRCTYGLRAWTIARKAFAETIPDSVVKMESIRVETIYGMPDGASPFHTVDEADSGFSHVVMVREQKRCEVAFMGSTLVEDWVAGPKMAKQALFLSAGHQKLKHGAKYNPREIGPVHAGLARKWNDIRYDVMGKIQESFKQQHCKSLVLMGFGTGGSLASMMAEDLRHTVPAFMEAISDPTRSDFMPNGLKVLTFGEPRLFGETTARHADESFVQKQRWLLDSDPVPGLIPTRARYRHWGTPLAIGSVKHWFTSHRKVCGQVASLQESGGSPKTKLEFRNDCTTVATSEFKSSTSFRMELGAPNYAGSAGSPFSILGRTLMSEIDAYDHSMVAVQAKAMCSYDLL